MDIHGDIHRYIHVWISDLGYTIWLSLHPWISMLVLVLAVAVLVLVLVLKMVLLVVTSLLQSVVLGGVGLRSTCSNCRRGSFAAGP